MGAKKRKLAMKKLGAPQEPALKRAIVLSRDERSHRPVLSTLQMARLRRACAEVLRREQAAIDRFQHFDSAVRVSVSLGTSINLCPDALLTGIEAAADHAAASDYVINAISAVMREWLLSATYKVEYPSGGSDVVIDPAVLKDVSIYEVDCG